MTWKEVTTSDLFREANQEERAEYKRQFFQKYGVPTLREQGLDDDELNIAADAFFNAPDDTGEGLLRSAVGSAARGFLDPIPSTLEVAGAFTGIESLEEAGQAVRGGIESMTPVNPAQEGFVTDAASILGQGAQILATGGAGAATGLKLAGKAASEASRLQAAKFGAQAAQQAAMGSSAVAGGLERADQLGLEGGDRLLRGAIAGGTEFATEKLGGFASELGPIKKFLGDAPVGSIEGDFFGVPNSIAKPVARGIVTEAGEEGAAEVAGQATDIAMAPETAPEMDVKQVAYAMLLGGVGGAMFGGVEAAITPRTKRAFDGTTDFVPSATPPPGMTVEEAEAADLLALDDQGRIIGYKKPPAPVTTETIEAELPVELVTPETTAIIDNVVATPEASATAAALARTAVELGTESGITDAGEVDETANLLTGVPLQSAAQIEPSIEDVVTKGSKATRQDGTRGDIINDDGSGNLTVEWDDGVTESVSESSLKSRSRSTQRLRKNSTWITQDTTKDGEKFIVFRTDENGNVTSSEEFLGRTDAAIDRAYQSAKESAGRLSQESNHSVWIDETLAGKGKANKVEPSKTNVPQPQETVSEESSVRQDMPLPRELPSVPTEQAAPQQEAAAGVVAADEATLADSDTLSEGIVLGQDEVSKGDLTTVRIGGREYPKTRIINVVETPEGTRYQVDVFGSKFLTRDAIVSTQQEPKKAATAPKASPQLVRQLGDMAVKNKEPVSQSYIDAVGGRVPSGYVKSGDGYEYLPKKQSDPDSIAKEEAFNEARVALRDAMNTGKGKFIGNRFGLLVTPSNNPDVMLRVTRLDSDGNPLGHSDIKTEEEFEEAVNDEDFISSVLDSVRPDVGQARFFGAFNPGKLKRPATFNYKLRLRDVAPGTVPDGFVSADGRNVSYNRPLTREELDKYEISPVGASKPDEALKQKEPISVAEDAVVADGGAMLDEDTQVSPEPTGALPTESLPATGQPTLGSVGVVQREGYDRPPLTLPWAGINPKGVTKQYDLPDDFYEMQSFSTKADPAGKRLEISRKYRTPELDAAISELEKWQGSQSVNAGKGKRLARDRVDSELARISQAARSSESKPKKLGPAIREAAKKSFVDLFNGMRLPTSDFTPIEDVAANAVFDELGIPEEQRNAKRLASAVLTGGGASSPDWVNQWVELYKGKAIGWEQMVHKKAAQMSVEAKEPVSASAIKDYNITIPDGYTLNETGDLYVYNAPTTPQETKAPSPPSTTQPATKEPTEPQPSAEATGDAVETPQARLRSYIATLPAKAQSAWSQERLAAADSYYATGDKTALDALTETQRKVVYKNSINDRGKVRFEMQQAEARKIRNAPSATTAEFVADANALIDSLNEQTLQKERENREDGPEKKPRFDKDYVKRVIPTIRNMLNFKKESRDIINKAAGKKLTEDQQIDVVVEWVQILKEEGNLALPSDFAALTEEQYYMLEPALKNLGIIESAKRPSTTRATDGAVVSTGVNPTSARAARNSYIGVIPGAEQSWLGTVAEFEAEFGDTVNFGGKLTNPGSVYEALVTEDGRVFIFTDNVQILEGDKARSETYGTTPGVEAVKRLMRHESFGHRGFMSLPSPLKQRFFDMVDAGMIPPEELDYLVNEREYKYLKDWRTDVSVRQLAAEEWLAQRMERMQRIPKSGPMQPLLDWLRDVWRWLTGGETDDLVQLRDIMREMHRALGGLEPGQRIVTVGDAVRPSYIGEKAQMSQFMRDSLDTAKAMAAAGKSSEEIRAVTGWFPGKYDGKMRWELPDDGARLMVPDKLKNLQEELSSAREALRKAKENGGFSNPEFSPLQVKVGNLERRISSEMDKAVALSDILDDDALFEAYPEIADVLVKYELRLSENGHFDKKQNQIVLNERLRNSKDGLSTLLHEVQHWIQDKENFARGGNAEAMRKMYDFIGQAVNSSKLSKSLRDAAELQDKVGGFTTDSVSLLPQDQIEVAFGAWNAIENRWMSSQELRSDADKLDRKVLDTDVTGYEAYRRLAGEIEARDIQARQNFTPAQRAATAPYSSENIAPEDAIVMFGGGEIRASRTQSPQAARHAALEAKFNDGTITAEETAEAEAIVAEAARGAGYDVGPVWHSTDRDFSEFSVPANGSDQGLIFFSQTPRKYGERSGKYFLSGQARNVKDTGRSRDRRKVNGRYQFDDGTFADEVVTLEGDDTYYVGSPSQIKSAAPFTGVPLDQRFDSTSNDIRASRTSPIRNYPNLDSDETKVTAKKAKRRPISELMLDEDGMMQFVPRKYNTIKDFAGQMRAWVNDEIAPYGDSIAGLLELLRIIREDDVPATFGLGTKDSVLLTPWLISEAANRAKKLGSTDIRDRFLELNQDEASASGTTLNSQRLIKKEFDENYWLTAAKDMERKSQEAVVDPLITSRTIGTVNSMVPEAGDMAAKVVGDAAVEEEMIATRVLELGVAAQASPKMRALLEELVQLTIDYGRLAEMDMEAERPSISAKSALPKTKEERVALMEKIAKRQTEILKEIDAENKKAKASPAAKLQKPVETAKQIINKITNTAAKEPAKKKTPDAVRELYRKQLKTPMSDAEFAKAAREAGLSGDIIKQLKDAIDLEIAAIAIEAKKRADKRTSEKELKEAEDEESANQKKADAKINEVAERLSDPSLTQDKAKKVDEFRKLYEQQVREPLPVDGFIDAMVALEVDEATAQQLFDIAALDADSRQRVRDARADIKAREISEAQASRLIYSQEETLRQGSKDREQAADGDSINKAFREQVAKPMPMDAFVDRLGKLKVTKATAERMYRTAERVAVDNEAAILYKQRSKFLDVDTAALANFVNELRRGGKLTGKKIKWADLLSLPVAHQETIKAQLLDRVKKHNVLRDLSASEQVALAEALEKIWQRERRKIFQRMIKRADMAGVSKETQDVIAEAAPAMLRYINQGMLGSSAFYRAVGEKFGIEPFSAESIAKIEKLAAQMQEPGTTLFERDRLAKQLTEELQRNTVLPLAEVLSSAWVTSVLSGLATQMDMALNVSTGMLSIAKKVVASIISTKSTKEARAGLSAFGSGLLDAARIAWPNLLDKNLNLLPIDADSSMAFLADGGKTAGLGTGEKMMLRKGEKPQDKLYRGIGAILAFYNRLFSGLDFIVSSATAAGTFQMAAALNPQLYDAALIPSKQDKINALKQAQIRLPNGTRAEQLAMSLRMLDDGAHLFGKNLDEAAMQRYKQMQQDVKMEGRTASYQEDPTGLGGVIYDSIKSATAGWADKADKARKEARQRMADKKAVLGDEKNWNITAQMSIRLLDALYLLASQAQNALGLRFMRFAGNKFNELISYIPGLGIIRLEEEGMFRDGERTLRGKNIMHNQAIGLMAGTLFIWAMNALNEDDEERGWIVNGSWKNLTPERKKQQIDAGFKENSISFLQSDGTWRSWNYISWPLAGWLASFGAISDYKRLTPEKWDEKSLPSKIAAGMYAGVSSISDISSLSNLTEMFGRSSNTTDPAKNFSETLIRAGSSYVGGFVPKVIKDMETWIDGNYYKPEEPLDFLAKELPFYRRSIGAPVRDIFAEPIQIVRTPWRRIVQQSKDDEAYKNLAKLNARGLWLTPPNPKNRKVRRGGATRDLTSQEADAYITEVGKAYKRLMESRAETFLKMPVERAEQLIEKATTRIREIALRKALAGAKSVATIDE